MFLTDSKVKVPVNFQEILKGKKCSFIHYSCNFLHLLRNLENYQTKFKKFKGSKHFVNISTSWFDLKFTRFTFRKIVQFLVEQGVIEVNRHFIKGKYTRGYRIAPAYKAASNWTMVEPKELESICTKISVDKRRMKCLLPKLNKILNDPDKIQCLSVKNIIKDIIKDAQHLTFEGSIEENVAKAVATAGEGKDLDFVRSQAEHSLTCIANGSFYLKQDGGSGRVYSPITCLAKAIRENLRWKGQKLYDVDIQTCQPSLLVTFYGDSPEELAEKERFIKVVTEQDFYSEIGKEAGIDDRKKAKSGMMVVMFGKLRHQNCKIGHAFARMFPILTSILNEKRRVNYKSIPALMQKMEADIMIKGVLVEFKTKYPDKPAFSIHDSFLVIKEDIEVIKEMMERHFHQALGFKPVVKAEH